MNNYYINIGKGIIILTVNGLACLKWKELFLSEDDK
jgi:hypothetical protein